MQKHLAELLFEIQLEDSLDPSTRPNKHNDDHPSPPELVVVTTSDSESPGYRVFHLFIIVRLLMSSLSSSIQLCLKTKLHSVLQFQTNGSNASIFSFTTPETSTQTTPIQTPKVKKIIPPEINSRSNYKSNKHVNLDTKYLLKSAISLSLLSICAININPYILHIIIFIGPRYTWGPIYGSKSL